MFFASAVELILYSINSITQEIFINNLHNLHKMPSTITENPTMEMKSFRVGMDPDFGSGSPLKLIRTATVRVVPGTELEIWFEGKAIYERRFGNTTEPRDIQVAVKDVTPYPNCNFWVDDRFLLGKGGIEYMQEIELRTTSPHVSVEESTFMDK